MMNNIFKILPYFIVEYLAKKYCEKITGFSDNIYTAFENSYIYKPRTENEKKQSKSKRFRIY